MTNRRSHGSGSVTARGAGRWQIRVSAGRDALSENRVRITRTVRGTKKQAERLLREVQSEVDRGVAVSGEKLPVAEWLDTWIASHRAAGRISASTEQRYAGIIRKHLKPALGSLLLSEIKPVHVEQVKTRWLTGAESTARRPLAPSSVHQHLVVLSEALGEAERLQLMSRNPVTQVKSPTKGGHTERRILTEDEIRDVLGAAKETSVDVLLRVALATGLRIGEMLGLQWSDIDNDAGTLLVQRNARQQPGVGVVMDQLKTKNARRLVELSPETVDLLSSHRTANRLRKLAAGSAWQDSDLVFCTVVGTAHNQPNLLRVLRRVRRKSGISAPEEVTFHTFRHTAATHWIKAGADIYAVSRRLGHSDAAFTMNVYGHMLKGMQATAAGAFDHLIAG
jgi:integrase